MHNKPHVLTPNHNPTPDGSSSNWNTYHVKASLKAALNNYNTKALGIKVAFTQKDIQHLQQPVLS